MNTRVTVLPVQVVSDELGDFFFVEGVEDFEVAGCGQGDHGVHCRVRCQVDGPGEPGNDVFEGFGETDFAVVFSAVVLDEHLAGRVG